MRLITGILVSMSMSMSMSVPSLASTIYSGHFELYNEPGYQPNERCDVGTLLHIDGDSRTAHLEEFVKGFCELYIVPHPRTKQIAEVIPLGCGSYEYRSKDAQLVVTDHRKRDCLDEVPAQIIVEEDFQGEQRTLYSYDGRASNLGRSCAMETGVLVNPNGMCQRYTNGCQKGDMLDRGYRYPSAGECIL